MNEEKLREKKLEGKSDLELHEERVLNKFFMLYYLEVLSVILLLTYTFSISFLSENSFINMFIAGVSGIIPSVRDLSVNSEFPKAAQFIYSLILIAIPFTSIPPHYAFMESSSYIRRKRSREMMILLILGSVFAAVILSLFIIFILFKDQPHHARRSLGLFIELTFYSKIAFSFFSAALLVGMSALFGKISSSIKILPKLKRE